MIPLLWLAAALAAAPTAEVLSARAAPTSVTPRGDLRAWALQADAAAHAADPALTAMAWSAEPGVTRAGTARFNRPELESPAAAGPLFARLLLAGEAPEVRAALVEAIARTGGDWAPAMVRLQAAEADAWVRLFILESARRAPEREALVLLRGGVVDPEARVRAAAVRAIPAVPTAAAAMSREVLAALGDPSAEVRAGAARSAGWMGLQGASQGLSSLVSDAGPEVRLAALRALERLHGAGGAPTQRAAQALSEDVDPGVRRAALSLLSAG